MFAQRTRKPLFPPPDVDLRPRWRRPARIAAPEHVLDDQDSDVDPRPRWKRSILTITPEYDLNDQDSDVDESFQNDSSSDDDDTLETDFEEALRSTELGSLSRSTLPAIDVFDDSSSQQQRTHSIDSPPGLREGHIRLVRIEVDSSKSSIHCTTRTFPLHERPSYTAISYTWGSPIALDCRYNITLDGHELLLPKNLWRFLEQASKTQSGWLWTDALSIDQHSPEERSHQVGIMSDIFLNAERVIVWLGPAYERSYDAMRALSKTPMPRHPPSQIDPDMKKATKALFVRPYWSRLWVYQELKLAQKLTVMCGDAVLDWEALESYVHSLMTFWMEKDVQVLLDTPGIRMVLLQKRSVGISLWSLLEGTRHLHCADHRDRVYALLSVALTGHEGIRADYTVQVADLIYRVLDNTFRNNEPKSREEAIARCLDFAEVFRANISSLPGLEELLKDHMAIPVFKPLTPKRFVESLGDAHRKRQKMRFDASI